VKLKPQTTRHTPSLIAAVVVLLVCFYAGAPETVRGVPTLRRLELMSYDWRVRKAADRAPKVAANLGFVQITDKSAATVANGELGYQYGLLWPRHIYGRVVRELTAQGAKVIAFDVLMGELRPDHADTTNSAGKRVSSDEFFVEQIRTNGHAILAAANDIVPPPFLRTNAWKLGHIEAVQDKDGVLRRVKPFVDIREWNDQIRIFCSLRDGDLSKVVVEPRRIKLPDKLGRYRIVHLDSQRRFDLYELSESGRRPPSRAPILLTAYEDHRIWNLGIVMAARSLKLDLSKTEFDRSRNLLRFAGQGLVREVPLDADGNFYIDWAMTYTSRRVRKDDFHDLLYDDAWRQEGEGGRIESKWANKIVVIGSTATGNNVSDRGPTPLEESTPLMSKHWNVANMFLTGRFVSQMNHHAELLLLVLLGAVSAGLTWKLRAPWGTFTIFAAAGTFILVALYAYVRHRYWVPIVSPVLGSLLLTHAALVSYQVIFEQKEKRRIRGVFAKLVSPNIVTELLSAETLNLGGARRNITVLFADVRGFTTLTDTNQANAEAYVKEHNLTGAAAEAYFDEQARETLETVNIYLATIADRVKEHDGTLDKYIGDCVMAFWGAPIASERHAVACVRCAVEAQRAMWQLNERRRQENKLREKENAVRIASGQPPRPLLARLALGTGINSGICIVGLMGSVQHTFSYTVFGREVNLASRLEGVSGRGRVIIGETTYKDVASFDAELAKSCVELEPVHVKGIEKAVRIFEVPWKSPEMLATDVEEAAEKAAAKAATVASESSAAEPAKH